MRDLAAILDKIIELIPEDHYTRNIISPRFNSLKKSCRCMAPEESSWRWDQVGETLRDWDHQFEEPWREKIIDLYNDKIKLEDI